MGERDEATGWSRGTLLLDWPMVVALELVWEKMTWDMLGGRANRTCA